MWKIFYGSIEEEMNRMERKGIEKIDNKSLVVFIFLIELLYHKIERIRA